MFASSSHRFPSSSPELISTSTTAGTPLLGSHRIHLYYPPFPLPAIDDDLPTHSSREQREAERRVEETCRYVNTRITTSSNGGDSNNKKKSKLANIFGGDAEDMTDELETKSKPSDASSSSSHSSSQPPLLTCSSLCELSFDAHATYLMNGLLGKTGCHSSLDSSRPWLLYWCIHGLDLLGRLDTLDSSIALGVVHLLRRCMNPNSGGFGGGPGQQAHTAPTYASVLTLSVLTSHPDKHVAEQAMELLREARSGILQFYLSCKVHHLNLGSAGNGLGGFRVSKDGEIDTRGTYTICAIASLLGILTPELSRGAGDWLARCQTYEGGLGGEPGMEAHGGYTYCGLAAAIVLNTTSKMNIPLMLKWSANRQMEYEGGFQGRTNKLVDGCYSFWVGALFPMLHSLLQAPILEKESITAASPSPSPLPIHPTSTEPSSTTPPTTAPSSSPSVSISAAAASSDAGWLFDTLALQRYLLVSCQAAMGGLRDKPGKNADLYHTAYCLSGLAVAQNATTMENSPVLGRKENILVSHTCKHVANEL